MNFASDQAGKAKACRARIGLERPTIDVARNDFAMAAEWQRRLTRRIE
jgi:hypothetical protein